MSLASWKKEFFVNGMRQLTKENAAVRSLKKWQGLLPDALKKHRMMRYRTLGIVQEDSTKIFFVSSNTCSLCSVFLDSSGSYRCGRCPLCIVRAGVPCDALLCAKESKAPFAEWVVSGDPTPMIKWLKKAVAYSKKHYRGNNVKS